jgi:hypothetical protein
LVNIFLVNSRLGNVLVIVVKTKLSDSVPFAAGRGNPFGTGNGGEQQGQRQDGRKQELKHTNRNKWWLIRGLANGQFYFHKSATGK